MFTDIDHVNFRDAGSVVDAVCKVAGPAYKASAKHKFGYCVDTQLQYLGHQGYVISFGYNKATIDELETLLRGIFQAHIAEDQPHTISRSYILEYYFNQFGLSLLDVIGTAAGVRMRGRGDRETLLHLQSLIAQGLLDMPQLKEALIDAIVQERIGGLINRFYREYFDAIGNPDTAFRNLRDEMIRRWPHLESELIPLHQIPEFIIQYARATKHSVHSYI